MNEKRNQAFDASNAASSLDSLLKRKDVWRGYSQAFVAQEGLDTGFQDLNKALLSKGWPESCLIECAQSSFAGTWLLLTHTLRALFSDRNGVLVLLNPPAMPYAAELLRMGLSTHRLIVVHTKTKNDFIACFVEAAKAEACQMLLAWQPKQKLSYTELRKCHLATHEQSGVYYLFRHLSALSQSSPSSLRMSLSLHKQHLVLNLVKQRGAVAGQKLELPLPQHWFADEAYKHLHHTTEKHIQQHRAKVLSLPSRITRKP